MSATGSGQRWGSSIERVYRLTKSSLLRPLGSSIRLSLGLALSFSLACGDGMIGAASERMAPGTETPTSPEQRQAREDFDTLCASCHGDQGEGASASALIDLAWEESALAEYIEDEMPYRRADRCVGQCAAGLAEYILATFTAESLPETCTGVEPAARRVRMLNRREYANSVRDLLGIDAGAPSPSSGSSCAPTRFEYDPAGRALGAVHVAGSFNDWNASAWPMSLEGGRWVLERVLPVGAHQYKFVLDGADWIEDPRASGRVDDGFGGFNSEVVVACDASAGGTEPVSTGSALDLTAHLPLEARPAGYLFDNAADTLQVTTDHLDEFLAAAALATAHLGHDGLESLAECGARARDLCVADFVTSFGRRAFRRPLTSEEKARYEALSSMAPSLAEAIEAVVQGMLVSPNFLYRSELGERIDEGVYRLTDHEVATALSYTLWATTPDEDLLAAADRGELHQPEAIASHARRLLADSRSRPALGAFARQWFGIDTITQDTKVDPDFDRELARAMIGETEAFFLHVVFEGSGRYRELLDADYTFVNERLAGLYGIEGVRGEELQRVPVAAGRRGILGHASILSASSHSDQSSPIQRGLFVREELLCHELGAPPPDANAVPEVDASATTRERFAQHTESDFCASCHQYIDPLGFGFEHFDAVGRWRDDENGVAIDASGDARDLEALHSDTSAPFETVGELGAILSASDAAPACMARQVYRFVRGELETRQTECAVDALVHRFHETEGNIQELLVSTFTSEDFLLRSDR